MRPLIFSAGSDGELGIATNPWTGSGEREDFSYLSDWEQWIVDADHYGLEAQGRDRGIGTIRYSEHPFPDPYLRLFVSNNGAAGFNGLLPGQELTSSTASSDRVDNVTNYSLQATE